VDSVPSLSPVSLSRSLISLRRSRANRVSTPKLITIVNGPVKLTVLSLIAILFTTGAGLHAAERPLSPYSTVLVDRFAATHDIPFPADYQNALAENIAREISLAFPTVIMAPPGDLAPDRAALRVSGLVTRFQPGSKIKRYLIGFGAGATIVKAQVWFSDAATGQIFLNREVSGITWTARGDSQGAADSFARKVVKLVKANRLIESQ